MRGPLALIGVLAALAAAAPPAQAETLYASGIDGLLRELNPQNGTVARTIGPVGMQVSGLAWDPHDANLYAIEEDDFATMGADARELRRVNKATVVGTPVRVLLPSPDAPGEIAISPAGTFYGWLEPGGQDLVRIDPASGSMTSLGESELATTFTGLAFSPGGTLFLAGDADPLYTINTSTSGAVPGPTLSDRGSGIASLSFDRTGTLFALRERTDGMTSVIELVTIDTTTGAVAVRGQVPDTIGSIAFDRTPPQPGDPGSGGPGPGGGPPPDTVAASVTGFKLGRRAFRAARRGPSAAAAVGTRVRYRLSEAATARCSLQRVRPGRPPRRRHSRVSGRFTHAGRAGPNSLRFTGRLRGRKLRPGRYRLVLVATDVAGNRSKPKYAAFRIVRR